MTGATRLSKWHPYPAMVADSLATQLAREFVRPGFRVLDPFCGSGRLLLAAHAAGAATSVGFDVNPLACLITRAKAATVDANAIIALARDARCARDTLGEAVVIRGATVPWLSERAARQLGAITAWINGKAPTEPELLVIATALSAATREVAWIRKSGWKLHRMDEEGRSREAPCAWDRFARRLEHYVRNAGFGPGAGTISVVEASAVSAADFARDSSSFDAVLTSPPYGDSRTTVQYGAASAICLDVVSRLERMTGTYTAGHLIDRACLGPTRGARAPAGFGATSAYWSGARESSSWRRASAFLDDYREALRAISKALSPGGTAAIVVGRRLLGGYRLRLDDFTRDVLTQEGLVGLEVRCRRIANKRLPRSVNRFGKADDPTRRTSGVIKTMDTEYVMTFVRERVGRAVAA